MGKLRTWTAATVAVTAILATGALEDQSAARGSDAPAHVARWMTTPCALEDSGDCYWDAGSMGSGTGHSFYAVCLGNGRTAVLYWQPRYARTHDRTVPGCNR